MIATGRWSDGVGSELIADPEPYASWRLIGMTLYIFCEPGHVISEKNNPFSSWGYNSSADTGAWSSVRAVVTKVVMQEGLETETMQGWFKNMYSLSDVSQVFIPQGCKTIDSAFKDCLAMPALPEGFSLPYGLVSTFCSFWGCKSLKTLPDGFALPSTLQNAATMFYECDGLTTLNADFSLSRNEAGTADEEGDACDFYQLFLACRSLKSLPYGFAFPTNATRIDQAFRDCDSLVSLPSTLSLDDLVARPGYALSFFDDAGANFGIHKLYDPKLVTYAVGDLGRLMPAGVVLTEAEKAMVGPDEQYATEVQCFWGEHYGRDLQQTTRTEAEAEVRFTVPDDSDPSGWKAVAVMRATAEGYVYDPGVPEG